MKRRPGGVSVDPTARLGAGVRLDVIGDGTIAIGAQAVLGDRCTFVAHAGISVGAAARLGDGVMVVDFDHVTADAEAPIRLQGLVAAPVTIGARAVIGHGASLLRGVTVGEGAEVGAHAVVTRDVPAGAVVEGVPAYAPRV